MSEQLQDILENWGMAHINPIKATNTGAAIATGIWHLGERYSLKTGKNFEGLRHHIHISRVLQRNGITASCPLVTLAGDDFITCDDHYYVITERVADNFLSTTVTPPEKDAFYLARYAKEIDTIEKALYARDQDFLSILAWSCEQAKAFARMRGLAFPDITSFPDTPCADAMPSIPFEGFICATKIQMTLAALLSALHAQGKEKALLYLVSLFVAWTGEQKAFDELVIRNSMTAQAVFTQRKV